MIQGWFYLHENMDLIYKPNPDAITDIRESDLCLSAWSWNGERPTAWNILIEALSLGANKERIIELAEKWKCNDVDAPNYANYYGIILGSDGNSKTATLQNFINIQESPCGFGDTYLEAMSSLCKDVGFKGGKMWNKSFSDIIKEYSPAKDNN